MRELTRLFIKEYQNPLGLLYSLYRGADVYADRVGLHSQLRKV